MSGDDTQELIEALEKCTRLQSSGGNGAQPFVRVYFEQPGDEQAFYSLISGSLSRARSADEQPTPPEDLVEEEALQRAVEAVAKIEMDREGYPLSRTQEEIYTDACETVSAVRARLLEQDHG